MRKVLFTFILCQFCIASLLYGQKPTVVSVDADHPVAPVQSTMWGVFFEDINMAADGGIYAELVKNRSFEFFNPKTGWKARTINKDSSAFVILNGSSIPSNPRFARIKVTPESKSFCLTNYGFRGMGVKAGNKYDFSMMASVPENGAMNLRIEIVDATGKLLGSSKLTVNGADWKSYNTEITSGATEAKAQLNIWFESNGVVDIDMVSLFPQDTWKGRKNGMRADLVQLLADLKPGFIRFPGGCIVEGRELNTRYQWKKSVGPVEERQLIVNRWNTEFSHRPTPDYFQSFGLGFYEYFLLAEDIGAEPVPILNCGMACQFNTAEIVPLNLIDPYIQDALDLIEFANGTTDTKWGKLRADMGHPEPFHLKMIGVGNEQWGPQYFERYKVFEKAILAKYPDIKIITGSGPSAEGDLFEFAWDELNKLKPQIVDEHYYKNPEWFLKNATRYDSYNRNGHKIFAGEYAAQSKFVCSPDNENNWECAISEAAFMTGLERNADIVSMCSYAPLFCNVEGWQWKPDLIWFDNLRSFGTPNYYVQKQFSTNKGTHLLKMVSGNEPLTGQDGIYASAVWDEKNKAIVIKMVNVTGKPIVKKVAVSSKKRLASPAQSVYLQNNDISVVNAFDALSIEPKQQKITFKGKQLDVLCAPYSFQVITIKTL